MTIGKREAQRLARRAQIIRTAREHFFEHGYDGAGMSAIAARLGGSKGTLWSYFPSKEALFTAVVEDTAASIRGQIDLPAARGEPLECLTRLCRSLIDRMTSPLVIAMYRLISPMAERKPELGEIFYERGPRVTQRMIAQYLEDNFSDLLLAEDMMQAGKDLVVLAAGEMHFERIWGIGTPPTAKQREAQAHHAARLFLQAYAKEPEKLLAA